MSRISEFIAATAPHSSQTLLGSHPDDATLRSLFVHLAFSDGTVQQEEFVTLRRVFPGASDAQIMNWVMDETDSPMDFRALTRVCRTEEERLECLRFAIQIASLDGVITLDEKVALFTVADTLEIGMEQRAACLRLVADQLGIQLSL